MFHYSICSVADDVLFYRQCKALERHIPGLYKAELLEDVDGTLVQIYQHFHGKLIVKNDIQVDALYIDSEFDIDSYFGVDSASAQEKS